MCYKSNHDAQFWKLVQISCCKFKLENKHTGRWLVDWSAQCAGREELTTVRGVEYDEQVWSCEPAYVLADVTNSKFTGADEVNSDSQSVSCNAQKTVDLDADPLNSACVDQGKTQEVDGLIVLSCASHDAYGGRSRL